MKAAKGYLLAELEVTDPVYFNTEYAPRVRPVLEAYGARFLVAGGDPEVREGDRVVKRIVLLEFDTVEQARAFYDSDAYQSVIGYRLKSANTHLCIMEGAIGGDPAIPQ